MRIKSLLISMTVVVGSGLLLAGCQSGDRAGRSEGSRAVRDGSLSSDANAAFRQLKAENPAAASLAASAKGVLVFPKIVKGGFVVGGFHGEGAMIKNGSTTGYYASSGGSYGLQAGLQTFSYALFFMTDEDLTYLDNSAGWEVGVGPTITVVDKGVAGSLTTTSARSGVYCFFFDQKGLMAGLGIQGSKITRID